MLEMQAGSNACQQASAAPEISPGKQAMCQNNIDRIIIAHGKLPLRALHQKNQHGPWQQSCQ